MFSFLLPIVHTYKLIWTEKEKYCKMEPSVFFWLFKQPSDKSEKQLLYKNSYRSIIIILLIISQVTLSRKNRTVDHRIPDFQVRNKLPTYIQSSELSQGCQGKGQFLQ